MVKIVRAAAVISCAAAVACFGQPEKADTDASGATDPSNSSANSAASSAAEPTDGGDSTDTGMNEGPGVTSDEGASTGATGGTPADVCGPRSQLVAIAPSLFDQDNEVVDIARIGDGIWALGHVTVDPSIGRTIHAWPIGNDDFGSPVIYPAAVDIEAVRLCADEAPPRAFGNQAGADTVVVLDDPAVLPWAVVGQVDTAAPTRISDCARDGADLLAAGYGTTMTGARYWRIARSMNDGATWSDDGAGFQLVADRDAEALALTHDASGRIIVAGHADDARGAEHWIVREHEPANDGTFVLDDVVDGHARAVVALEDGSIVVGGAVLGEWRLRMSPGGRAPFETLDLDLSGAPGRVVDLAVGPEGALLALGETMTATSGITLLVCDDPSMSPGCWTPLIDHEEFFPGGSTVPRRMFVDGRDIWIAGTATSPDGTTSVGALYRYDCAAG